MLTVQDVFESANCSDHPLGIDESILEGAETIVALGNCCCTSPNDKYATCGSYCDSESFAVAKLADGRYIVVRESSDSSGHG